MANTDSIGVKKSMALNQPPILIPSTIQQVGIVVRDCEKTAAQLNKLFGWGPWDIDYRDPNSTADASIIQNMKYYGKPGRFGYKMAETKIGSDGFIVELIEPTHGENSIYYDQLQQYGEGVQHVGWHIVSSQAEYDKNAADLEARGFRCTQTQRMYASQYGYFDTSSVLKTWLEISYRDSSKQRPKAPRTILHPDPNHKPIVTFNKAQQFGFVVRDCERTAEQLWRLFGIGPWDIDVRDPDSSRDNQRMTNMVYRGKPGRYSYKMAEAKFGPNGVSIELIQPLSGENIYTDFLEKNGEGFHHLGWHILPSQEEFDSVKSSFEAHGFPCLQTHRVFASQGAFYETTGPLKTLLEVSFRDPAKKRPAPTRVITGW